MEKKSNVGDRKSVRQNGGLISASRNDLLGRWYNETKSGWGGWERTSSPIHQNDGLGETVIRIAKQAGVVQATVERAET